MYTYQNDGELFICGDFNSRCGDIEDCIESVDNIDYRKVLDYNVNKYGHFLIDFLLSSNMCMLNGRNSSIDEYSCITPAGTSVVGYCLVTHERLKFFTDCKVTKVSDIINLVGHDKILVSTSLPDRFALSWKLDLGSLDETEDNTNDDILSSNDESSLKFNVKNIPLDLMADPAVCQQLHSKISELESSTRSQIEIDGVYSEICMIIKDEIKAKLLIKCLHLSSSSSNKNRRVKKPR